ncbi:uncharacterized protein SPAPADRAFT_52467 [Spathaspora passalidarum NRRL Y-27907]|uniref:Uncharacterized protein n=1 Tax=Spathaspora passalidarum (strain NRRL Y-27907 / 11-Y1) TaxID=619300 RepID=G3AU02_SPAPN|nr:uncharacterized protein SPAPADRAFT_52467 [Spathaspora passalidarum NRRL Y-27907]EGW30378.1 hypothetical protein SPAPADRAFT_52467 [Spathaspora passalidarum NRRL Y-27907]
MKGFQLLLPVSLFLVCGVVGEIAVEDGDAVAISNENIFYPEYIFVDEWEGQIYQEHQVQEQDQSVGLSDNDVGNHGQEPEHEHEHEHDSDLGKRHEHQPHGHHNPSPASNNMYQRKPEKEAQDKVAFIKQYTDKLENKNFQNVMKIVISVSIVGWVCYAYVFRKREAKAVPGVTYNYYQSKDV